MKRTKLYKLIITVLVIINVGMLVFFFAMKPPHGPPGHGDLVEKLGLEGSKVSLITKLEKEHHTEKKKLMRTDRRLHKTLFSKLGTDEDVSSVQNDIEANHAEIEKMTYSFFNEISKHCNDEQKVILKRMIHHAFNQMRRPPHRR